MDTETTKVAIACQGGGSHTAFTAGVLEQLLENWPEGHELVGISGTSGGAFNALAAWYGLMTDGHSAGADIVTSIWDDLSANTVTDRLANSWLSMLTQLYSSGAPVPQLSPYQFPGMESGKERIREVLERHIDFDAIPEYCERSSPELVVGTVDINAGEFETFTNEDVTVEAVLASAAVPTLFKAVKIHGHYHWDGLFSQNPPVNDLLDQPVERKPEELWIIQINDQKQEGEPTRLPDIVDRRNELSGNISLNQEIGFIKRVSEWVEDGTLPEDEFTTPDIHRIELNGGYSSSSKTDRSPEFIAELVDEGRASGTEFLAEY